MAAILRFMFLNLDKRNQDWRKTKSWQPGWGEYKVNKKDWKKVFSLLFSRIIKK